MSETIRVCFKVDCEFLDIGKRKLFVEATSPEASTALSNSMRDSELQGRILKHVSDVLSMTMKQSGTIPTDREPLHTRLPDMSEGFVKIWAEHKRGENHFPTIH